MTSNKKSKKGEKNMMNNEVVKSAEPYLVDLVQIEGDGTFPCPKCGTRISPDDETEEVYQILDTKVSNDELVELVISCCTCNSVIRVTGFQNAVEA